jgi:Ni/Fe-hydrogenase b-type cytochrome subunit
MTMNALVYRHNRITRITHWTNAIGLMILFMSGLMIFNAHPSLYWGHTSEPEKAFLSIGANNDDEDVRGYVQIYGRQIDTTGVLGVQQGTRGPSARAFPSWLTIPGYYSLAGGRRWHFFFGWVFALNGLLYVIYNIAVGHMRKFLFTPADAAKIPAMIAYYLHLRRESPQVGEYNPLQKMAYSGVFMILTPLVLVAGMAMSPQLNVAFNWLPAAFGGRQSARSIHFILAFSFLFFVFGHVFMVITQGLFNNMRSMITGWYKEKAPRPVETPRMEAEPQQETADHLKADAAAENKVEPVLKAPAPPNNNSKPETAAPGANAPVPIPSEEEKNG